MAADVNFGNYSPDQYLFIFSGADIQGFADGTFMKAVRNEKSFKTKVGARGSVTRIRSRNFTGTVTITLQSISDSNDVLQGFLDIDEDTGLGFGSLMIKDLNGNTVATAETAWVTKVPDLERNDDAPNTEWEFECAQLILKHGGSLT
jgi:hypothetical protein